MSAAAAPACPICQWPAREKSRCRHCGWRLVGGYVVGTPSAQAQQELTRAIAAARRRHALRIAVRAASWRAGANLGALAELAGAGTAPSDREIEDAIAAYDREALPPAALGIGFTLSRLVGGETDAIDFVEVSPDGLAVCALEADDLGVPRLRPGGHVHWTDVLPELPADGNERLYLLAGGVGDSAGRASDSAGRAGGPAGRAGGPAALADSVAGIAAQEIAGLTRAMAGSLVLVRRTRRWPGLDAAAATIRALMRPVAELYAPGTAPLSAIVTETIRWAPLRYDYDLVLADVDQDTGRVRPASSLVFPAGTTGQPFVYPTADTLVTPAPGPTAAGRLALPVVARHGEDPAGWRAVGVGVMDGTTAGITRVRVRLEAPGQVGITATPEPGPGAAAPGWPDVLALLPARLPGMVSADVVLLAELGGSPEAVDDRMRLLESVAGGLGQTGIKVAIIGYREHWETYPDGLLVICEFADSADLRPRLARRELWQAVRIRDKHAAPLEDALATIALPDWAWRPGVRHLLVVFASRPPHPRRVDARGESPATQCQEKHTWQDALDWLRRKQAVECMVVLPAQTPSGEHAERVWAELGTAGRFRSDRSSAADLLRAIGIEQADDSARLPLAMAVPGARSHLPREEGGRP
ncbi:MAG TPA: hypothetical protein VKU77_39270 [Streptosporangiaceae bacterium]|nr:hypothetical protein [Streptosporangiaceae bacterium]